MHRWIILFGLLLVAIGLGGYYFAAAKQPMVLIPAVLGIAMFVCGLVAAQGTMQMLANPTDQAWTDLPPMAQERVGANCCVLPSGRVAVVGGNDGNRQGRRDGEAFDPVARTWQPLPPMALGRSHHGVVAVAGGLLAVGGRNNAPHELFDEASGRWFELPHPMAQACVVTLPAAALAAPVAVAAVAAAQ